MPTMTSAIGSGGAITHESFQNVPVAASSAAAGRTPVGSGPGKISVARLPVTGGDLFGREEDINFLDDAWANRDVNVVTIVAWAGVGKSTLVNHWLRRMAAERYRSAQLVFGWSFYTQSSSGGTSSADEFLDAALTWFGDPDPRPGMAWEKGAPRMVPSSQPLSQAAEPFNSSHQNRIKIRAESFRPWLEFWSPSGCPRQ